MRDQYQQQTNLLPIALLLENTSTSDLHTRLQWSTTMFDTTGNAIAELQALQVALEAKKARQAELEKQIAADRREAAAQPAGQEGPGGPVRGPGGERGLARAAAAGRGGLGSGRGRG